MEQAIQWLVDDRVGYLTIPAVLTLQHIVRINHAIAYCYEADKAPIHMIIDMRRLKTFPLNIGQLTEGARMLRHPHAGWLVTINTNPVVRNIVQLVQYTAGYKAKAVVSYTEAVQTLQQLDPTLVDILATDPPSDFEVDNNM